MVAKGHKIANVPLIRKVCAISFKTYTIHIYQRILYHTPRRQEFRKKE
jgi:hypothetical protein